MKSQTTATTGSLPEPALADDDLESPQAEMELPATTSTAPKPLSAVRRNALLILLLSLAACAGFLVHGVRRARAEAAADFDRRALELVHLLESTWLEYEHAALQLHNTCRQSRNTTRSEFRAVYEYLLASGLQLESAQCSPNVTHAQRAWYEAEARAFYAQHYPTVNYQGIIGFVERRHVNETGHKQEQDLVVVPSPPRPFYFPVHYLEPVLPNAPAIELDMYSFPSQKLEIDLAVATRQPVLSARLIVVQEQEDSLAYSVIIYHPGVYLEGDGPVPTELSLVLVRIPSLLERVAQVQEESLAVYLYDTTVLNTGGAPAFLGAGNFRIHNRNVDATAAEGGGTTVEILDEIEYDEFRHQQRHQRLYYETTVPITPSGSTWKVAVVPLDDTFDPYVIYVGFGGAMIVTAGLFLAIWYHSHLQRDARLHAVRAASEAEKAALIVRSATQAAQAERELNDFLAHEVRNPLTSAIAAANFVTVAVQQSVAATGGDTESSRNHNNSNNNNNNNNNNHPPDLSHIQEDMAVINHSLHYINDLLRDMLDMHKIASHQMRLHAAPADLRSDILEPVATLLYQKKYHFAVHIACPTTPLMAVVDHIRLKQIVLNLCNNSCKFVERGFVRLGAYVDDDDGHVRVFVEDSGPGIPASKRDHLFVRFQSSLDTLCQGTGIGLSLCRDLAELMNGSIALDESFDSGIEGCPGTRFVIDLNTKPLETAAMGVVVDDDEHAAKNGNGDSNPDTQPQVHHDDDDDDQLLPPNLRILFTDDDATLRKLFKRSLQRVAPSWTIQEAANGETAVRLATTSSPTFDVIFLDQYMASVQKQMLGTETTRALRAAGYTGIICGLSANAVSDAFYQAGADAFLVKPFPCDPASLRSELRRVLRRERVAMP